jgi:Tol biopolymer transport system component
VVAAAWRAPLAAVLTFGLALGLGSWDTPAAADTATGPARADLGAAGAQANRGVLQAPSISADGRWVAFASSATNLVPEDTNGYPDIFVRDRTTGITKRVSVTDGGGQANGASSSPVISADGRWVAFTSYANNLSLGDLNFFTGGADVFLHDLVTGRTVRVSNSMLGLTTNGENDFPTISADGRYVGFDSTATDLIPDDANSHEDVFVWDRQTQHTVRASVAVDGAEADAGSGLASISADGSRIAFISAADNLVDDDSNGYTDAFVKDLRTGAVTRVDVDSRGKQAQGDAQDITLSPDGNAAAFTTAWPMTPDDQNFSPDVYRYDLIDRQTTLLSRLGPDSGDVGYAYGASLDSSGDQIVFTAAIPGTNPAGSQVYLWDRRTEVTRRLTDPAADGTSHAAVISPDGAHLAWASAAQNLVPFDNNHAEDLFVLDPGGPTYPVSGPTAMPRDVYPPHTTITAGPPTNGAPSDVQFAFAADETPVSFQCRWTEGFRAGDPATTPDDQGWVTCPQRLVQHLAAGPHRLQVRATDAAGNADPSPAEAVFTVG